MSTRDYSHHAHNLNKPVVELVSQLLDKHMAAVLEGAGERMRNNCKPDALQARVAELEAAIDDVLSGTPLDKHGNRNDDGMDCNWNKDGKHIDQWRDRLRKARGAA